MSTAVQPKPRIIGHKTRICIVASRYNEKYSDGLVDNTIEELAELLPAARIDLIRVPGAFEIPVAIATVLEREECQAVVALGVIIKGATAHGDLVASAVTNALQQLAVTKMVPVIHEVLLVEDEKQAYARTIGQRLNRGREAARAAAAMIDVMQDIDRIMPKDAKRIKSKLNATKP